MKNTLKIWLLSVALASGAPAGEWVKVGEGHAGHGSGNVLVGVPDSGKMLLVGGAVQAFDPAVETWSQFSAEKPKVKRGGIHAHQVEVRKQDGDGPFGRDPVKMGAAEAFIPEKDRVEPPTDQRCTRSERGFDLGQTRNDILKRGQPGPKAAHGVDPVVITGIGKLPDRARHHMCVAFHKARHQHCIAK